MRTVYGRETADTASDLGWVFFGTNVKNRLLGTQGELGEQGGFTDAGLTSHEIHTTFGEART